MRGMHILHILVNYFVDSIENVVLVTDGIDIYKSPILNNSATNGFWRVIISMTKNQNGSLRVTDTLLYAYIWPFRCFFV